jgi:methionine aminopeptidase
MECHEPRAAFGSSESSPVTASLDHDGRTVRTLDGSISAHEEHTIMFAANGPVVLAAATCG